MKLVDFSPEGLDYKIAEWKFNKDDENAHQHSAGARYGMIALGRSADSNYIDCMYVMYKMDFSITPREIVTQKDHSILWGLFSWTTTDTEKVGQKLGAESVKSLQNFFRLKALQGFYKEGLIEKINKDNSLDDIWFVVVCDCAKLQVIFLESSIHLFIKLL